MEIEKGVPVPTTGTSGKYPWAEMEDGDSFVVSPREDETYASAQRRISNNGRQWLERNRPGWKIVTKKENDNAIRVWILASE
jgi:hypothetical protein